MKKPYTVQDAVAELKACHFECEAGNIEHSIAFIWLEEHAVEIDALMWKASKE